MFLFNEFERVNQIRTGLDFKNVPGSRWFVVEVGRTPARWVRWVREEVVRCSMGWSTHQSWPSGSSNSKYEPVFKRGEQNEKIFHDHEKRKLNIFSNVQMRFYAAISNVYRKNKITGWNIRYRILGCFGGRGKNWILKRKCRFRGFRCWRFQIFRSQIEIRKELEKTILILIS